MVLILAFALNSLFLLVFLMADFVIRAFTEIKFSPVSYTSYYVSNALSLSVKMIDKAPKIFSARLGFLMTTLIALLFILNWPIASMIVGGLLILFAGLEFIFAICVGCMIYTYLVLPFYKKEP